MPPKRGPKSPPRGRERSPTSTGGAPGWRRAKSASTPLTVASSRPVPQRRQLRLPTRLRIGSQVT